MRRSLWTPDLFPRVLERVPGAQLWLVGNGPSEELRSYASESITITGRVPDVQPYLARASAFVSPLRVGVGMKNKVLEALAMGCPLVASPLSVDGIAVTEGHDAIVAEGDALAAATVRVCGTRRCAGACRRRPRTKESKAGLQLGARRSCVRVAVRRDPAGRRAQPRRLRAPPPGAGNRHEYAAPNALVDPDGRADRTRRAVPGECRRPLRERERARLLGCH